MPDPGRGERHGHECHKRMMRVEMKEWKMNLKSLFVTAVAVMTAFVSVAQPARANDVEEVVGAVGEVVRKGTLGGPDHHLWLVVGVDEASEYIQSAIQDIKSRHA